MKIRFRNNITEVAKFCREKIFILYSILFIYYITIVIIIIMLLYVIYNILFIGNIQEPHL